MVVLGNQAGRHSIDINLDVQTTGPTVVAAGARLFTVVVKHGNMAMVVVEAGIVLPRKPSGLSVTEVVELVVLTT